ncbi:MAG: hypothetical protein VKJ64_12595 [Leptolyngbyaceae bacterium]|nr:hypothetical protein [Leptolyngbyaceae bacterium]
MNAEESIIDTSESTDQPVLANPVDSAEAQPVESQNHPTQDSSAHTNSSNHAISSKETIMATEQTAESSAIQLSHGSAVLGNRPVGDNGFAISGTMTFSGIRPIEVSTLAVYGTLLGGRPIEASDLAVMDVDTLPGHRPIFASTLAVVDSDTLPEHRPIEASPSYLMQGSDTLPNHRPIASNAPDAGATLMGFLD